LSENVALPIKLYEARESVITFDTVIVTPPMQRRVACSFACGTTEYEKFVSQSCHPKPYLRHSVDVQPVASASLGTGVEMVFCKYSWRAQFSHN